MSFRSSLRRESAWSALTEISLAQISIISVIALPVERAELFNADWYPTSSSDTSKPIQVDEVAEEDRRLDAAKSGEVSIDASNDAIDRLEERQESIQQIPQFKSRQRLVSDALNHAYCAVLLDNAENYEGALEAYDKSIVTLQQLKDRTTGTKDPSLLTANSKLEQIQETYMNRTQELMRLCK